MTVPVTVAETPRRLAESFRRISELRAAREGGMNHDSAEAIERQLVWRELIDLELQDIDERIQRIAATAGVDAGIR